MSNYTFDSKGIPHDEKGNPIAYIQRMIEPPYTYVMYYAKNNRYYKYCVCHAVMGRVTRISFQDFLTVLKGDNRR